MGTNCMCKKANLNVKCQFTPGCPCNTIGYYHFNSKKNSILFICSKCAREALCLYEFLSRSDVCNVEVWFCECREAYDLNNSCLNHWFGCKKCAEGNMHKNKYFISNACIKLKKDREVAINNTLDSIRTNGLRTFGNLNKLIISYIHD